MPEAKTYSVALVEKEARMFVELTTKAAVTGPDAATLASLYDKATAALKALDTTGGK